MTEEQFLNQFLKEFKEEDCLISSGIVFHASIATGTKEDLYIFYLYFGIIEFCVCLFTDIDSSYLIFGIDYVDDPVEYFGKFCT